MSWQEREICPWVWPLRTGGQRLICRLFCNWGCIFRGCWLFQGDLRPCIWILRKITFVLLLRRLWTWRGLFRLYGVLGRHFEGFCAFGSCWILILFAVTLKQTFKGRDPYRDRLTFKLNPNTATRYHHQSSFWSSYAYLSKSRDRYT